MDHDALSRRHSPGRLDRQLQDLAQRRQILSPWSDPTRLPEVNADGAHADLFGNGGDRQPTLDTSVAEVAGEAGLAWQCDLQRGGCGCGGNLVAVCVDDKDNLAAMPDSTFADAFTRSRSTILTIGHCIPRRSERNRAAVRALTD